MKWSIPIVVVALAACILAGSLGFQDTIKETTEYESVLSDLSSIADAGPVTDTVNYNPLTNVTGWSSNVSFETQSAASLYKYETNLIWSEGTSAAMNSAGVWVLQPEVYGETYLWKWSNGDTVRETVPTTTVGDTTVTQMVVGGWSGNIIHTTGPITQTISSSIHATLGGTQYAYARTLQSFGIPNNSVIEPTDGANGGLLGVMTANPGSWFFSDNTGGENIRWSANMDLGTYTLLDFDVYYLDGLFYRITSYDDDGRPQPDMTTAYNVSLISDSLSANFTYSTLTGSTVSYIKPYTLAQLRNGIATWANGYGNTTVKILADADNVMFSVNDEELPEVGFIDLQVPAYVTWATGYTGKVLFTLNADGNSYWQGVTSFNNTKDFTVADYQYPLLDVPIDGPITKINFLYVGGTGYRAAIVDTWMPRDSNGLLWGDATFPIDMIFPTIWAQENLRVKFNSFVTTGTGVTINGVTYPVTDGNVTIDEDTFKLAGSSIEWTPEGDTTLVAPNGDRYDLGTRTGTFTLNGVWYGVLSLDTFQVIEEPAKEAVYGEMPAVGWMAWVFLGVLVVCTVGVLATGRQLDITDMLALALLGFASLTVAVIT